METILIKADNSITKLLIELAIKMAADVSKIKSSELENFVFGRMLNDAKTGKLADKEDVINLLKSK